MVTPQLQTNRDLYLAIENLAKQQQNCDRSLEDYLRAVLNRSREFSHRQSLTLAEFYQLIACGFTDDPEPFDESWRALYETLPCEDNGYTGWHATVLCQIVDLREMDECGTLKNEMRFFGISAPRESYWYNFDPLGYLECAMAGSFGGWEPDDDTGRQYVRGQVAVFTEEGSIRSVNPEDVPNPTFEMAAVTWGQFKDFVTCGQSYE